MEPVRWIAFGDVHFPFVDEEAFRTLLEFVRYWKPREVLFMGDIFDLTPINRHDLERRSVRNLEGKRLIADYEAGMKSVIMPVLKAAGKARFWWMDGNHEAWAAKLVDRLPGLEGMVDPWNALKLDRYFEKYGSQGSFFQLGKLAFCHGDGLVRGAARYCAARAVERYGSSILVWHYHTRQVWSRETLKNEAYQTGFSVPCLCNLVPYYSPVPLNAWVHGFAYGLIEPDGQFHVDVPVIWRGRLFAAGRLFGSGKRV